MKQQWKGIGKVFQFTFMQQVKTKGYRLSTILLAILCLALPAGIMALSELFGGGESAADTAQAVQVKTVYTADLTGEEPVPFEVLNQMGTEGYAELSYQDCGDSLETAEAMAAADDHSLILVMDKDESGYRISVLIPENSALSGEDASGFEAFLNSSFSMVLFQKSGLNPVQLIQIFMPTQTAVVTECAQTADVSEGDQTTGVSEENGMDMLKTVLSFVLPYLNIMVLYFLVLIYGQSVANSVILEKTSKLMDTFLVSVSPNALIFGKVFATVLSSALQFVIWLAALAGGFGVGSMLVRLINPGSDMLLLAFFDSLSMFSGLFSIPGIILAVFMVFAGFLLYCSLAAIGGSLAGKPEDLSSTNVMFTMVLIISFFCTLYAGGLEIFETGTAGGAAWLNWVPFTAILVTPSRILLEQVSLAAGAGSLAVVLIACLVILMLAGRVYRMMSLFKGNPPGIAKIFRMLGSREW